MKKGNTVELKVNVAKGQNAADGAAQDSLRKDSSCLEKPSCKNGVCEIVWKPIKPAA